MKSKPESPKRAQDILHVTRAIGELASMPMRFMEVCGTHTMSIFRHGLRSLLPKTLELVSGPGCPVCVTSQEDIDRMIAFSFKEEVIVATFGDLVRVPGSRTSLAEARASGARVEIVYSPANALEIASKNPDKQVVFLGVGFETTAPTVAATILEADARDIQNFSVFSTHKVMPPALDALFRDQELGIDGLLCPGHVSAIIGARAYEKICQEFDIPCVVAGFEPEDILRGVYHLVHQKVKGEARVENVYERAVTWEGNQNAIALMEKVFEKRDARWRGLGTIKGSGLAIRDDFSHLDAERRFDISLPEAKEKKGCLCGEIIRARALPPDCSLFGRACTPTSPVGPCMVSSEGTCSAYYRYGGHEHE